MKYISKRDLGVVSATATALAVIALGIYISANYRMVRADDASQISDKASVTSKQDNQNSKPSSNSQPVERAIDGRGGSKLLAHVRASKVPESAQLEEKVVQLATRVQQNPEVAQVLPTWVQPSTNQTEQASQVRPERADNGETWRNDCTNCSSYSTPRYEPAPEKPESRGMTKREKIVVGGAIAGSYVTSIVLARRHR